MTKIELANVHLSTTLWNGTLGVNALMHAYTLCKLGVHKDEATYTLLLLAAAVQF